VFARGAEYRSNDRDGLRPPGSFVLVGRLARGLVEDAGPALDAAPDLGEGCGGSPGKEEEGLVAVEAAFQHDRVPMRVPYAELAECLVARDHGTAQRAASGLAEEAPEDVENQSAEVREEFPVVTEEHARDLRDCQDELAMGQGEKQVLAEVLAHKECSLLCSGKTSDCPPSCF
jgi:hypothetical protein